MPTRRKKPSFLTRARRAIRREFRRIRDELRPRRKRRHGPPLRVRMRHRMQEIRKGITGFRLRRKPRPHLPPLSKRIGRVIRQQREKYAVVFSARYLVIALNSTVLFLLSFFLVHFLTHLATGLAAGFCEISTTLNYTMVDFHIRYWDWTPEMVIIVFTVPAVFAALLAVAASLPFLRRSGPRKPFLRRFRYLTKKQRIRHRRASRKAEIELQVQRLEQRAEETKSPSRRRRIPWSIRLFLLWTSLHSLTYLFSGMLYAFLFHRRFGYVIWYAFNNIIFDALFGFIAFTAMLAIGWFYAAQFFNAGRVWFNTLNDRNRMPFAVSLAFVPFAAGTVITVLLQLPKFDPSLILLNFSLIFFLIPIPSRSLRTPSKHFDNLPKPAAVWWGWILAAAVTVTAILVAVKYGVPIDFH